MISIGGYRVLGATVDAQARCEHYRNDADVISILFHCCREWYPCVRCHDAVVRHSRTVWPAGSDHAHAILCGACATTMTIAEYRAAERCPRCAAPFNPGCALHHPLYFS
ncbi:hypothetical protein FM104_04425 [Microbacterium esteraromaticum]|uniref:CHY-type domain-containing protein n=1 Tax=Microbacterium esteraromaticum TaxID=57043 RepID=A0A1R4IWG8_9MICO|nr:CHY zinc finger protein [Microbacterium esteraromaticum]SJN24241.1 hypothetical protein FM104_04425 [Microbacterium esteraromaticum]